MMTNNLFLSNVFRFLGLVLFQVLILNNINLSTHVNPYLYPLFLLFLPFRIPHWSIMLLGFLLGISVDMFTNTLGVHAATCVFIAFSRKYVIEFITPKGGYEVDDNPTMASLGLNWFFKYALVIFFLHHLSLFFLEYLSFDHFFFVLSKILMSLAVSLFLVFLYNFLFKPER